MRGLLVRVAADQSEGGGRWNGPVDAVTGEFVYAAIPEAFPVHPGLGKPYAELVPALARLNTALPPHLAGQMMHLDPDFEHLTYGDQGERANQIRRKVGPGDLLVFYAGLRAIQPCTGLVYALIGLFVVDALIDAQSVPPERCHENAHTRRILSASATDVVVRARPGVSGRLERCIPIGSYRSRAYRVRPELLSAWGGLGVRDGYLQRSARLPELADAGRFLAWWQEQRPTLRAANT